MRRPYLLMCLKKHFPVCQCKVVSLQNPDIWFFFFIVVSILLSSASWKNLNISKILIQYFLILAAGITYISNGDTHNVYNNKPATFLAATPIRVLRITVIWEKSWAVGRTLFSSWCLQHLVCDICCLLTATSKAESVPINFCILAASPSLRGILNPSNWKSTSFESLWGRRDCFTNTNAPLSHLAAVPCLAVPGKGSFSVLNRLQIVPLEPHFQWNVANNHNLAPAIRQTCNLWMCWLQAKHVNIYCYVHTELGIVCLSDHFHQSVDANARKCTFSVWNSC